MNVAKPSDAAGVTIEAWAQGYMAGSLIVMACIAVANMRKHVLLHKLIVVEVSRLHFQDKRFPDHLPSWLAAFIWVLPRDFYIH